MRIKSSKTGEEMSEDFPACGPLALFVQNQLEEVRDSPQKTATGTCLLTPPLPTTTEGADETTTTDEVLGFSENDDPE